ncbi:bifunctional metallophosphatase/5'-nucleotidase [Oryzobacter sp. R7]|uniref:bifunctional metallophosphatase/5'-nucleotidase n=1 Tax=Oryzobacter faecalis TaxID=3388656 RepID=UPI00398CA70F
MTTTHRRVLVAGIAATTLGVLAAGSPATAADWKNAVTQRGNQNLTTVQLLSFNDYHGNLEALPSMQLAADVDPARTVAGGAENLSTKLSELRAKVGDANSLTVTAGDLIGGSAFISGMFHDEPSVESLNAMGLDVSGVGNHEFDEGTAELLRMQNGGCHPVDGCYFPDEPYLGADFQWLAANVVRKANGQPLLPATSVKTIAGQKVGFIGMTLEETPTLVNPSGVSSVEFKDEVQTANAQAALLKQQGVKAIVVLLHEGGMNPGTYNSCTGISDPIATMATQFSPEIDQIITGHTHDPYVCSIPDPAGQPRLVTSTAAQGMVVTETSLVINKKSGEVDRSRTRATNHLVPQSLANDPVQTEIIAKWNTLAGPLKSQVVGTHTEPITGDSNGNRGIETPMADLVADAILDNTEGIGAQIGLMNVGGVRASLNAIKYGEQEGEITYAEAFDIAPFGNVYVALDLTGAQLKAVLEQQFVSTRSRQMLALGVSDGFSYTWDPSQPEGSKVVASTLMLDGNPIAPTDVVRVGTLNFLADGGDSFTAFSAGTNRVGGSGDLEGLVKYFQTHPALTAPPSRVAGL